MIITSLPPVHMEDSLAEMIEHPFVDAVRYNTGMRSPFSPAETLRRIQRYARPVGKPVFVDLKGKQLRIIEWANLPEGPILLNHKIKAQLPAKVYFRGDERPYELKEIVDGNQVFVDPIPLSPVGQGQSVNILSAKLEVEGGLIPTDCEYIAAAMREGIYDFMLSFVEGADYVRELEVAIARRVSRADQSADHPIYLKIESQAGLDFVAGMSEKVISRHKLMAARDDLMIHIGVKKMPEALKTMIQRDKTAVCASRLLMGLEEGEVSMADVSDIEYMKSLGYSSFMLSDGISHRHFKSAISFLEGYLS